MGATVVTGIGAGPEENFLFCDFSFVGAGNARAQRPAARFGSDGGTGKRSREAGELLAKLRGIAGGDAG